MKKFMLRRTKTEIDLPPIDVHLVWLNFSDQERILYDRIQSQQQDEVKKIIVPSIPTLNYSSILETLIKLRQICVDSNLLTYRSNIRDDTNVQLERGTKMKEILKIMKEIWREDPREKIVIFTQFVKMMDIVEYHLSKENINCLRFDGNIVSINSRNNVISKFKQDPDEKVIIVSLKAGGVGITLLPACKLIMIDAWWNAAVDDQAIDRIHRFGQTKKVSIYRLLMKDSIEEKIMELQNDKSVQAQNYMK